MTEPSGLSPEHDAVRRLLADVRHDGPAPAEVVARLDETLASLAAERGTADDDTVLPRDTAAPVVDLGARRRRRAGVGLLAAAAVVVAGVALGQGLPGTQSGDDSVTAGAGRDSSLAEAPEAGDSDGGSDAGGTAGDEMAPDAKVEPSSPPTLSSLDLGLDQDLLDLRPLAVARSEQLGSVGAFSGCDRRGMGPGRRVDAVVDGFPGVVVFRRASGDAQDVEVFVCGSPEPVRTLTLPAP